MQKQVSAQQAGVDVHPKEEVPLTEVVWGGFVRHEVEPRVLHGTALSSACAQFNRDSGHDQWLNP